MKHNILEKPNILEIWERSHITNIFRELKEAGVKPTLENISPIIEQTSFRVRSIKHPKKCPYYSEGISCHPEIKDLNCFLCACPQYLSHSLEGGCKIGREKGKWVHHHALPKGRVWDCSGCNDYHSPNEVRNYLIQNLAKILELAQ
jgi:Zn-finger protein